MKLGVKVTEDNKKQVNTIRFTKLHDFRKFECNLKLL